MELIVVRPEEFGEAAMNALDRALAATERPSLGIPTGSTPVPLYERLAEITYCFPPGSVCFALDEYVTARADATGTNAAFFRRHWPAHLPTVTTPDAGAADPEAAIAAHCRAIAAHGGLEVVLLGIGRNGHIAFNEPGSERDAGCRVVTLAEETRRAAAADWPEGAPTRGMTIGVREIMAARRAILLVTGPAKAAALRAAITGPVTATLPASYLQEHRSLVIVCDTAAWSSAALQ